MLTLGEASRVSGRAKASILAAMRDGRLSASRDETGRWQIDPAELTRVYPVRTPQPNDTEHAANADVVRLEERVQGLERLLKTIDDLDAFEEMLWRDLEARAAAALPFPPSEGELDDLIEQAVISAVVQIERSRQAGQGAPSGE